MLIAGVTQYRVDDISKEFTSDGWKSLPQELVDAILSYLLVHVEALKACSLTCKRLFSATRPLIHRRTRLVSRLGNIGRLTLLGFPFRPPRRAFERLVDAERWGLLHYIRHLTLEVEYESFTSRDAQEYLPHLRSITTLHALTLDTFHPTPFLPFIGECLGTNTVRHLDLRKVHCTNQLLLSIISQFPLLEDLSILSPTEIYTYPGLTAPTMAHSPPFRGKLVLANALRSKDLLEGLAAFPSGLNFRSLVLSRCKDFPIVLAACSHTVTSISYLWSIWENDNLIPLNLERSVILEWFELGVELDRLSKVHEWVHQTLRTITSPLFKEFSISILNTTHTSLQHPVNPDGWMAVDTSLDALVKRNPDFRVVLRADFSWSCHAVNDSAIRKFVESYLPLVSSKGVVKFEHVPYEENQFWKKYDP